MTMDVTEVRLLAVGSALPGPAVDNATLAARFGMSPIWEQWVENFIGTRYRHLAVDLDSGEIQCSLADLAESAGRRAMMACGVSAADIDLIVMGTATPDLLMPATVNMVADRLGINDVPTYQLQSGCAGAVQALDVARKLMAAEECRTALVLGGDSCAKHFPTNADLSRTPPAQLVNLILFGDGAGAAVLSTQPRPGTAAVRFVLNRLTGLNRQPGQVIEWFGVADRDSDRPPATEDYQAIAESVPVMAAEILAELLDTLGWTGRSVTHLLPPQLSGRMTERIVERLGLPDATEISCVGETGNNANALPFLQLERALPTMSPGDRALGIAVESSKWIKAGFALEMT
jgi:3-oxoacyl-[acyl-carrier-protein] synthase-3